MKYRKFVETKEVKIAVTLLVMFFLGGFLLGAEQPVKKITTEDIDGAIRNHITNMSKADGMFHVQDDVLNQAWNLKLRKVHNDSLTALDANTYFACADFKSDDATLLDVDFYVKNDGGRLVVTDTAVHKVSGEPRFTYEENGEFFQRIELIASKQRSKEHPQNERSKGERSRKKGERKPESPPE